MVLSVELIGNPESSRDWLLPYHSAAVLLGCSFNRELTVWTGGAFQVTRAFSFKTPKRVIQRAVMCSSALHDPEHCAHLEGHPTLTVG